MYTKNALSHMSGEGVEKKQGSGSMKVNGGKVSEYKCCFFKLCSVFILVHVWPTLSSPPVTITHPLVSACYASAPAVAAAPSVLRGGDVGPGLFWY